MCWVLVRLRRPAKFVLHEEEVEGGQLPGKDRDKKSAKESTICLLVIDKKNTVIGVIHEGESSYWSNI